MMFSFFLDRNSDAPPPAGASIIASEVDFLQAATRGEPVLIRGESLCHWAETFAQCRGYPVETLRSPTAELRETCPDLTADQAQAIMQQLGSKLSMLPRPLNARTVLVASYPFNLWHADASLAHGARWLLWLVETNLPDHLEPLLRDIAGRWRRTADSEAETLPYTAWDSAGALRLLDHWFGLEPLPDTPSLGDFPVEIPQKLRERILRTWRQRLVESRGAAFAAIVQAPVPTSFKHSAAVSAVEFYLQNPDTLTIDQIGLLAPYLDWENQDKLRQILPPQPPPALPDTPAAVLHWFKTYYLPFRAWQRERSDARVRAQAQDAATAFAHWYLEAYAKALAGAPLYASLSFARLADMAHTRTNAVTLVVVLDGLHVGDGDSLRRKLEQVAPRLSLVENDLAFVPLPTVTEFCKDSLICGVPPSHVSNAQPLGAVFSESNSPSEILHVAEPGTLCIWRLQEPDRTYHARNPSKYLHQDVDAQLHGIAERVAELTRTLPEHIHLRVVLTADHGRLLGRAVRNLPAPLGMTSHGRAAWGNTDLAFPETGYFVQDNCVFLAAERFYLPTNAVAVLDEGAFLTNDDRRGSEIYPHGGLYPEEVIVPWLVLARDVEPPQITVTLRGNGQSGRAATTRVEVNNSGDFSVTLVAVELDFGTRTERIEASTSTPRLSTGVTSLQVAQWPAARELERITGTAYFQIANGRSFSTKADVQLTTSELYSRDDDILEGLDL